MSRRNKTLPGYFSGKQLETEVRLQHQEQPGRVHLKRVAAVFMRLEGLELGLT